MWNRVVGIAVVVLLLWMVTTHSRPAPTVRNATPADYAPAKFHWSRRPGDVDRTIETTVVDGNGNAHTGRLLEYRGSLFTERGGSTRVRGTNHYYLIDPGIDIGAVAGYRPEFSGTEGDTFSVGLRASPVRLFYGTLSPDVVIAKDWVGAGVSAYAPSRLVGPDWKHLGAGIWYGYPTRGSDYGSGGWCAGLSFTIR